jgi:uncharacterized PurR-regulated membrane protein YhhQ (DUF165 family)
VKTTGLTALFAFVATIFVANWLVQEFGVVNVGFGLRAPAAVFVVGVAFTLRDIVQRTLGRGPVIGAILVGALLSLIVAPAFAFASAVAFLFSELCDLALYTPLERRSFLGAVAASNLVGLVADSIIFLWLAFGSLAFFWGQVVGKAEMTLLALPLLYAARRALLPRHA